ncbi:MAG TPA: DUF1697 domain-containing protein [Candidatus Acidoferrales bacterium]|nr:DUF1697 domain-containing protein [Candidatus Acidoferrales bacterium]
MPVYIALLRGVNVGGNTLKMDRLRELCAELGLRNVRTLLQSGNVVFEVAGSAPHWAQALERKLTGQARLPVSVMVKTVAEWSRAIAANPFLKEKGIDTSKLLVTFLDHPPAEAALERLRAVDAGNDRFHSLASAIYLNCPNGYGRSKLSNNVIERLLSLRATTRNWNTVRKLADLSSE